MNDDASGPDLNVHDLKGVTIAVTGKIERPQTQPWMIVKSTTQIQTRSPVNTDYISHAHEKEAQGDLDGAMTKPPLASVDLRTHRPRASNMRIQTLLTMPNRPLLS